MTGSSATTTSDTIASASRRGLRIPVIMGWVPLVLFAVGTAIMGQIGADVRIFQALYVAAFVGYLGLLRAVYRCRRSPDLGAWRWWWLGCVVLRVILLPAQPGDDAHRYIWEGRVQLAGFNPYAHAPDDPALVGLRDDDWEKINHRDYPAIYGPVAQAQFLAAVAAGPSALVVKSLHLLWDVLLVAALGAWLRRRGELPHLAIGYALCPLVLTAFSIEGHVDSLMLMWLVICAWAVSADRQNLAGVVLGLAISTKIVAIVLLPWFVIRCRRAALVSVFVILVCYLPYWIYGGGVLLSLTRFSSGEPFFSLLGTLSISPFDHLVGRVTVVAVLGVALFALGWRHRDFARFAAGAMGALVLLMPVVHYWYLSWVLVWVSRRPGLCWIGAALAMVVYFEAERGRQMTGTWSMPSWAPIVVWMTLAVVWAVERIIAPGPRRDGRSSRIDPDVCRPARRPI